ncbi:hypothetical protein BH10PSE1_BH10PSE1_27610 [soil metagenome]
MRVSTTVLTVALIACSMSSAAPAQTPPPQAPRPVPIEEWSQAKVIAMGQAIYDQDTAAWRATDALVAALAPEELGKVRGWVVEPSGQDQRVRFLKAASDGVEAGWDIIVVGDRAGPVTPASDPALTDSERTQFTARQTAAANPGPLRCSAKANSVVLKDPDSDGWLVWILTSTTDNNIVPMGGHYRFRISGDGKTVLHRDQLSNSCLNLSRDTPGADSRPAMMFVTQIVSSGPVETHVFLSLQNRLPIYVGAGERIYEVNGAHIRDAGPMTRR